MPSVERMLVLPCRLRLPFARRLFEGVPGQEAEEEQGVQLLLWHLLVVGILKGVFEVLNALHGHLRLKLWGFRAVN
jgi:hypothetical protein